MTATIILLVGPSSAGKTSLAKALQGLLEEPFLHFRVDEVMTMVPQWCIDPAPRDTPPDHGGFWWQQDKNEPNAPLLTQIGPFGHHTIFAIHRAIQAIADCGINLIVEDMIYEAAWLEDYLQILGKYQVLFVTVRCSIPELERREIQRGDRQIGQARGDLIQLYNPGIYDLEINTDTATTEECVQCLLNRLQEDHPFLAWSQLKERSLRNDTATSPRNDEDRADRHRSTRYRGDGTRIRRGVRRNGTEDQ